MRYSILSGDPHRLLFNDDALARPLEFLAWSVWHFATIHGLSDPLAIEDHVALGKSDLRF